MTKQKTSKWKAKCRIHGEGHSEWGGVSRSLGPQESSRKEERRSLGFYRDSGSLKSVWLNSPSYSHSTPVLFTYMITSPTQLNRFSIHSYHQALSLISKLFSSLTIAQNGQSDIPDEARQKRVLESGVQSRTILSAPRAAPDVPHRSHPWRKAMENSSEAHVWI